MILATVRMNVHPAKQEELLEIIRWRLEPTRVEKGCVSYNCYQDIENENVLILVEEWKSKADLDRHIRTDDYRNLLFAMDLLTEPPEVKFNTVSETGGFEVIEEARGHIGDVNQ